MVCVEGVAVTQICEHLAPLHGVGVAQTEHAVPFADFSDQGQCAVIEADGGATKFDEELARSQRQIVVLHDGLGERSVRSDASLEAARQFGPMHLHFFTAPASRATAGARDQTIALKIIEHSAHVEDHDRAAYAGITHHETSTRLRTLHESPTHADSLLDEVTEAFVKRDDLCIRCANL